MHFMPMGAALLTVSMTAACTPSLSFFGNAHDDAVPDLVVQHVLSSVNSGETFSWSNQTTQQVYQLSPLGTFRSGDGSYCRDYTIIEVGGKQASESSVKTACLVDDTQWHPVDPSDLDI